MALGPSHLLIPCDVHGDDTLDLEIMRDGSGLVMVTVAENGVRAQVTLGAANLIVARDWIIAALAALPAITAPQEPPGHG